MFKKDEVKTAHIIDLAVNYFNEMRYYNFESTLISQESNAGNSSDHKKKRLMQMSRIPPPDGRNTINVDSSKRYTKGLLLSKLLGKICTVILSCKKALKLGIALLLSRMLDGSESSYHGNKEEF